MGKQIISTEHAPAAVGPYSQGVRAGKFLYTAGQIALDPATGKMVGGDVSAETSQVMKNLQAILGEAGFTLDDVVKTTVFLQDMDHFAQMNAVYGQFFEGDPPARSTVQVSRLPLGALVEIEAVALVPAK
jgi:2-iminobutanoate/2-iminopropanoate deaminase